jgi:glycosyltransferase involved in cell wall biosynthesis
MGGTDVHVDLMYISKLEDGVRSLLEGAGYVTFFTEEAKRVVLDLEQKWEDKLIVVPQGVLPPGSELSISSRPSLKCKNYNDSSFTILLPAGLRKVKDVLHLLESWVELDNLIPQLKVIIIGENQEQLVKERIESISKKYPFIQYVQPIPFDQMGQLYKSVDVVINTSIEEGQPTAIGEAMAYRIPVIVRDNAGNRSMVNHRETGYVYKEPAQFTEFILGIIRDPIRNQLMIEKAYNFILNQRSVDQEIEAYLQLFRKMNGDGDE